MFDCNNEPSKNLVELLCLNAQNKLAKEILIQTQRKSFTLIHFIQRTLATPTCACGIWIDKLKTFAVQSIGEISVSAEQIQQAFCRPKFWFPLSSKIWSAGFVSASNPKSYIKPEHPPPFTETRILCCSDLPPKLATQLIYLCFISNCNHNVKSSQDRV